MDWEMYLSKHQVIWEYPGHGAHASYVSSNVHSDYYINSDCLSDNQSLLREVCVGLFEKAKVKVKAKPDWIVTYPPFGTDICSTLSELFGCKFASIKSLDEPYFQYDIRPGDKVLFCADDLRTGSSFRTVLGALIKAQAELIEPLLVVANFSGDLFFDGHEIVALVHKNINVWDADNCSLCAVGSHALSARENWQQLCGRNLV